MSSFYNIENISVIERGSFEITLSKIGFASNVEIQAVGIQASGSYFTDWTKSNITTQFPWDGFVTFKCNVFYFYFTGEEYTVCVRLLDQADGKLHELSKIVIFPLLLNIDDRYQIPEIPTQQTQNVYYDNVYKGNTSSCLANAIASVKEVQSMRKGSPVQGSVGWFWGKTGKDETGTEYDTAFQALTYGGIPPYQVVNKINGVCEYPDTYFLEDARAIYKSTGDVSEYAKPQKIEKFDVINPYANTLTIICDSIKNPKLCVILSIAVDNSIESEQARTTGIVPPISNTGSGGHAMIVLGWQTIDNKKYWVCKNSWCYQNKSPMGADGYYFIPFSWGAPGSATGIASFYVLKDDNNAPALPKLPITIDAFMIGKRGSDSVTFGCTEVDEATEYRLRWIDKDTTKEIYTYSTDLVKPTFKFLVWDYYDEGARWGHTYIVNASAKINGVWCRGNSSVQITLLPHRTIINKGQVSTVSPTSLAVKVDKFDDEDDVGKFTGLRVFRGYEKFTQITPAFPFEDFIDILSYDELAVFNGLDPGSTWAFTSRAYLDVDNRNGEIEKLWSYWENHEIVATVGAVEPFKWTYPKTKNQKFNLTADEWNGFTARVNLTRVSKGLPTYSFQPAIKGQIFTADHYNSARQAIQAIQGCGVYIPTVKKGDAITADMMNILVTELNAIA